jgi:cytidylate kinase
MKKVITISREFGCNARGIAQRLANELGFAYYDKDLIDLTAQKIGIAREAVAAQDEIAGNKSKFLSSFAYGSSTSFYSEKAISAQAEVIREAANKEDCILFGRCADYILREYPNCLHIFLYAPLEDKIKHISEVYELDVKSAESMIKKVDRQRHNYYKYVTGRNRGDRSGKNLSLDVAAFGEDKSVELLVDAVKMRFDMK